ncbi:hypothetical protein ACH5RR_019287 [Cinchona calisaya]|uniref:Mitochondrial glycoprotein n=1 Tax=Cinchona calisaya TaxID=153742 RepID=A0ABD2ZQ71_9GENT
MALTNALRRAASQVVPSAVQVKEIPPSFPFKLQDNPGLYNATLTREYQGETIVVEVPIPFFGEYADNDDDDGDEKGAQTQSELPLEVIVSKSCGPCLRFGCTAFPDDIVIDSLSFRDPDISEDQIGYAGPGFSEFSEKLQKAFHKYLEISGVNPSTTIFLLEYMINKDDREYVKWLKNLKKFVVEAELNGSLSKEQGGYDIYISISLYL